MFIDCFKNNGVPYLRIAKSVRVKMADGSSTSKKDTVVDIGPLSRFDDGEPNYLGRLRDSFTACDPLIPWLRRYCPDAPKPAAHHYTIYDYTDNAVAETKLYTHRFLERMLEELGISQYFSTYKAKSKMQYDLYGFFKLLVFGRLLHPASKWETVLQNDAYYDKILQGDFNPDNVYDTLDFVYENRHGIIRRMNTNLIKKMHRSRDLVFYDVTNFYFEIEEPDPDVTDEDGVVHKGLRKCGVSKEHRPNPIVQMGMFMDGDGIPISIEAFPGNTLDHTTVRTALKNSLDTLKYPRYIFVADRGMCAYNNLLHILQQGNGYIVSKSLLKSTAEEQKWAYSDEGYIRVSDEFRYKSRVVEKTMKDEYGIKQQVAEKVVVFWSKRFYDRSVKENKSYLQFLDRLMQSPNSFRVTTTQAKTVSRFFKNKFVDLKSGEYINSSDLLALLDYDKIDEYKKNFGYFQIVTSELKMDPLEVIDKYHGLSQIEDQFRVMKGSLETRPMYVRTPEHIQAHLLICLVALVCLRLTQNGIKKSGLVKKDDKLTWSNGMSADRVIAALNDWQVEPMPDETFRFANVKNPDLQLILKAFDVNMEPKIYTRSELKSIKTDIQILM